MTYSSYSFIHSRQSPDRSTKHEIPNTVPEKQPQLDDDGLIYMDYNATTPIDPRVLAVMQPALTHMFGNPSAKTYKHGWQAMSAVDKARCQVAKLINAESSNEIIFTSGATECNGLAIRGIFENLDHSQDLHFITSRMEHNCVLEAAKTIELDPRGGVDVTYLGVPESGITTAAAVKAHIRKSTVLVSIMLVNNEIGVRNEIEEIGKLCKREGILFHVDGAQGLGKMAVDVQAWHVDMMSSSSHKLYGPKGVGALYIREKVKSQLQPLLKGGGQEGGLRGGTHNVPAIVGFGAACEIAEKEMASEIPRMQSLRDDLLDRIRKGVEEVRVNGSMEHRVAGNLSVSFPGVDGEALLTAVNKHLAVSSGSACKAASGSVSHVMAALCVPEDLARATLRFGLGRYSTEKDVCRAAEIVVSAVNKLYSAPTLQGNPGKMEFNQSGQLDAAAFHDVPEDPEVSEIPSEPKPKDITKSGFEPCTPSTTCSNISETSDPESNTPPTTRFMTGSVQSKVKRRISKLDELANESVPDHLSGLTVIGYVSNQYNTPQYIEWRKVQSRIQVAPDWVQGLDGVDEYSHLIIVWMMNLVGEKKKTHVPQGLYESVPKVGIFSCRCPQRPNPLATTIVRLIGIEGEDVLVVEGLDAVNGSPVLDIKPYDTKWDDLSVIRPGEKVVTPMWTSKLTY